MMPWHTEVIRVAVVSPKTAAMLNKRMGNIKLSNIQTCFEKWFWVSCILFT